MSSFGHLFRVPAGWDQQQMGSDGYLNRILTDVAFSAWWGAPCTPESTCVQEIWTGSEEVVGVPLEGHNGLE